MKMIKYFEKGDKVKVIKNGCNASDFNKECDTYGVYGIAKWAVCVFEIMGNFEPITFDHSEVTYGAYPLGLKGKLVGYVYNEAIDLDSEKPRTLKEFRDYNQISKYDLLDWLNDNYK